MTTTIAPTLGQAPEWLQLGPGAASSYGAIDRRRVLLAGAVQEGAVGPLGTSYKVTAGAGMTVSIAATTDEGLIVKGDSVTLQGLYYVPLHSAAITETITAAHATLPRIDQIVAEVLDASHDGGASNLARTRVVDGTATSGATLDNRTGAAALPSSAMRLADLLVPAASSSVSGSNIRDRRQFARGAYRMINRVTSDYTTTGSSLALVDSTNVQPRLECSGVPLTIKMHGQIELSTAGIVRFAAFSDAAVISGIGTAPEWAWDSGSNRLSGVNPAWDYVPAAGSHLIGLAYRTSAGTATLRANSTNGLQFVVQEHIRANTDNT